MCSDAFFMFQYYGNSFQRLGKAWVWDLLWGLGQFWAPEANREAAVAPALGAEVASLGQLNWTCKEVKDSGDRYLLHAAGTPCSKPHCLRK